MEWTDKVMPDGDKNKNEGQQQSSGFQRDYKNRGSNRSTGSNSSAILQEMQKQTSWQQKQTSNSSAILQEMQKQTTLQQRLVELKEEKKAQNIHYGGNRIFFFGQLFLSWLFKIS